MQAAELPGRFASSPVARLPAVRPDGALHVVPVVSALVGGTVRVPDEHPRYPAGPLLVLTDGRWSGWSSSA